MGKLIQNVSIVLLVSVAVTTASPARLDKLRPSKSRFLARQEVAEDAPAPTPYPPAGIRPAIPFNLPTDEKLVAPVNYYLPPLPAAANFNVAPAEVYGPPAKTYGPPEVSVKDDAEEVGNDQPVQSEEQPEEEKPQEDKPEEESAEEEKPEEGKPEEEQPEEEQSTETTPEEDEESVATEPAESQEASPQPEETPNSNDDADSEAEPEEDLVEVEPVAVEETVSNALPERLILARVNNRRAAKLRSAKARTANVKSAKLQLSPVAPLRRQAQPIILYSYNGQLFRL